MVSMTSSPATGRTTKTSATAERPTADILATVALSGVVLVAVRRGGLLFPWPLIAFVIVVAGMGVGLHFTTLIVP